MPINIVPLCNTLEKTPLLLGRAVNGIENTLAPLQGIGSIVGPIAMAINAARITSTFMHDEFQTGESTVRIVADLLGEVAGGCIGSTLGFTGGQFLGADIGMVLGGPLGAVIGGTLGGIVGSVTSSENCAQLGKRVGDSISMRWSQSHR